MAKEDIRGLGGTQKAAGLYDKAKAAIKYIAGSVADEAMRSTFLQSARVQAVYDSAARVEQTCCIRGLASTPTASNSRGPT